MEAVLIDNNDSFTYNIVELVHNVSGQRLPVISSEQLDIGELENFDKFILSPGPGLPKDFPVLQKILDVYHTTKSMLGICLGHEAIAQFFGADLVHLPSVVHGQPKKITVRSNTLLFKDIPEHFNAGLYHSWVIDRDNLPPELLITAVSGEGNIMSFQHKDLRLFGIQFHPESIITEYGRELMKNFLNC